jgi:Rieske Fe-S protein
VPPLERRRLPVLTTRRTFVGEAARALAVGAVSGATLPLLAACQQRARGEVPSPTSAPSGHGLTVDVHRLTADGEWMVAPSAGPDDAPVLVVRQSATLYVALSMQCTHMGCPIDPPVQGIMTCPCHGSQFDLAGQVRHGPAQYPLGRYAVVYRPSTGVLTITFD